MIIMKENTIAKKDVKVKIYKRFLSFLIDFILCFGVYFLLYFFATKLIISNVSVSAVTNINDGYEKACVYLNEEQGNNYYQMIDSKNNFGIKNFDRDNFIYYLDQTTPNLTESEKDEKYSKAIETLETKAKEYDSYKEGYKEFNRNYYLGVFVTLFIPNIVFYFLIPLFNKNERTIGMFIFKLNRVNIKNDDIANKYKVLLNFFVEYIVDGLLMIILLGELGIFIPFVLSIILLLATKSRLTIGDALSISKVIEEDHMFDSSLDF